VFTLYYCKSSLTLSPPILYRTSPGKTLLSMRRVFKWKYC
jgi:hypothetical protein